MTDDWSEVVTEVIIDHYYDPWCESTTEEKREWHVFALFLMKSSQQRPKAHGIMLDGYCSGHFPAYHNGWAKKAINSVPYGSDTGPNKT